MAMRLQYRVLYDVANNFSAWQFTGVNLLPLRQQRTRSVLIRVSQRISDLRKVKAELPESQCAVEHQHSPNHGNGPSDKNNQSPVNAKRGQRGTQCGK